MSQTVARCEAAMPLDLLSAWHDHEVPPDVALRVRQHVATCQACQAQLAAYEADGRAIHDFAPPPLQDAIWRNVQPATTQSSSRHSAPPRSVILGGLGATLAVVLLFATISVIYLNNHGHSLTVVPTGTPAATNTLVPTATVQTLSVSSSQGWVTASALASYGKSIAFAQNDPYTGYACGNGAAVSQPEPLFIGTTHDGGLTWSTPVATSVKGVSCSMVINPSNAQDLIMTANICYSCDTTFSGMYRSLDAGHSWVELKLPSGNSVPYNQVGLPVWIGATLYVVATTYMSYGGPQPFPAHLIAVSQNGGALSWIDDSSLLNFISKTPNDHMQITQAFALASTYYVYIDRNGCTPNCSFEKTSDEGKIWTTFTFTKDIQEPVSVGGDGTTLLSDAPFHPFLSTDQGHTWKVLPAYPQYGDVLQKSGLTMAPDGTIYIELDYSAPINYSGLYKLPLNATTWIQVVQLRSEIGAVSCDTKGHAIAAWRINSSNDFKPGIQYHAA